MKIAYFSTFDILPANDGGRRRYLAMTGELSKRHDVVIVGYHLTGSLPVREYKIGPRLRVAMAQAASADANHCWHEFAKTQRIAHDVMCIREYRMNQTFMDLCEQHIRPADVVVVSHPYLIMIALTFAARDAIIVYESHNVELDAKTSHFSGVVEPIRTKYLADVAFAERLACQNAHYVTAVSDADARRLEALYDLSPGSVRVSANGVDLAAYPSITADDRSRFWAALGVAPGRDIGVFLGSGYGPNVSSYRRLRAMLDEAGFDGTVVLVGSIADADRSDWEPVAFQEVWLGYVTDEVKALAVSAADVAFHFMFEGAGTNLKLFDYMAARTPVLGNAFGFRGVAPSDKPWNISVETADRLREVLRARPWQGDSGNELADQAFALARDRYDWAVIGDAFDKMLHGITPAAPVTVTND